MNFYLNMTRNPEVQKKAQREIDEVVGNERLPTADDIEQLPYIRAIVSEAFRFHPVDPLGMSFLPALCLA